MRICLACCWFCSIRFWGINKTKQNETIRLWKATWRMIKSMWVTLPSSETLYRKVDSSTFRRGSPINPRRWPVFRPLLSQRETTDSFFFLTNFDSNLSSCEMNSSGYSIFIFYYSSILIYSDILLIYLVTKTKSVYFLFFLRTSVYFIFFDTNKSVYYTVCNV
jgi:hypothetical protein